MTSVIKFIGAMMVLQTTALVTLLLVFFFVLNLSSASAADPSEASVLYNEKCAGCHTIGGGNSVGPDLAPVAKWKSADLSKSIKDMEKNVGPLTVEEVESLVEYLKNPNTTSQQPSSQVPTSSQTDQAPAVPPAIPVVEHGSASRGGRLFCGDEALSKGGLSCIACHRVDGSGGTMGLDLTGISAKMTEPALVSACERTPYKVMKEAYRDHPVTHDEAVDLAAYLTSLKDPHGKLRDEPPVTMIGLLIAGFVFAIIAFGYRNRNSSVRAKLQRRD